MKPAPFAARERDPKANKLGVMLQILDSGNGSRLFIALTIAAFPLGKFRAGVAVATLLIARQR
jgi:hypothetical protein